MPITITYKSDPNTLPYLQEISKEFGLSYEDVHAKFREMLNKMNRESLKNPKEFYLSSSDQRVDINRKAYIELKKELNNPDLANQEQTQGIEEQNTENAFGNAVEQNLEQTQTTIGEPAQPAPVEQEPEGTPAGNEAPDEEKIPDYFFDTLSPEETNTSEDKGIEF